MLILKTKLSLLTALLTKKG